MENEWIFESKDSGIKAVFFFAFALVTVHAASLHCSSYSYSSGLGFFLFGERTNLPSRYLILIYSGAGKTAGNYGNLMDYVAWSFDGRANSLSEIRPVDKFTVAI